MWLDLSVTVTQMMAEKAMRNEKMASFGHLGTHFDVMALTFPLDYAVRRAVVFDVLKEAQADREISLSTEALSELRPGDFAIFRTGAIVRWDYGTEAYFGNHPQLSRGLIDQLIERRVAMIGIDAAGIRRGAEHTPMDQYCADRGVFVVENLCQLENLLQGAPWVHCQVFTFPVKFEGMSGLPCRVMAYLKEI